MTPSSPLLRGAPPAPRPRPRAAFLAACCAAACISAATSAGAAGADSRPLLMATTTSTAQTGLLDHLLAAFEKEAGRRVEVIAVGSGAALKHGENGDVDLVLAHAPAAEEAFVGAGFGLRRVPLMENDFVLLGPAADPARARAAGTAAEALRRVAGGAAPFVSRGDRSGTHEKELELWRAAGVDPGGPWYIEAGQGMGACLTIAHDRAAYLLSDRGTFLARGDPLELEIVVEGDPLLRNPYSLIPLDPARHPGRDHAGAEALIDWLTSARGQAMIAAYRVNGHALFRPATPPDGTR
ncbi:MAG: substrate-binding domain-containing protein [Candidatus Eisenbacteria bacterium]|uniref:Substrate-binding domain-containing protein n=1 Tax=Eiseniibacteriota bacterium TaxID=2212470 RepID=A0A938BR49_UNCEI|nr:substrate-binding domain-containing protein [Candidatus Eisenbacteria bacterium]